MSAQIIPRSQWVEFARSFSERHQRWLVTARWRERLASLQLLVQNALLERVSVSLACRSAVSAPAVDRFWLDFASDLRQIPRHELMALSGIRYYEEEDGMERLELETDRGAMLLLWFRRAPVADEPVRTF